MWRVKGKGIFVHKNGGVPTAENLLTIKFESAVLTSISQSQFTTGETMTLQTSDPVDQSLMLFPETLLPGINVTPNTIWRNKDLAFTFTNIKTSNNNQVIPIDFTGSFLDEWTSEGSFSASGNK